MEGEHGEERKWWRWRDEVWSSGKCAGGMGEWRSVRGGAHVPLWHVMLMNTNTCMVGSGN